MYMWGKETDSLAKEDIGVPDFLVHGTNLAVDHAWKVVVVDI